MKRDELPLVTLDGRRPGELLAHPCDCGRPKCTLGEHVWQSTRDAEAGIRANSYEPRGGRTWPTDTPDSPEPTDTTTGLHDRYRTLLQQYQASARNLTRFIDSWRPDRYIPLPPPLTDDDWCRAHLDAGYCVSRDRGDLCTWCYNLGREYNATPDRILIRARESGTRITNVLIGDWLARVRVARNTKRKRAS